MPRAFLNKLVGGRCSEARFKQFGSRLDADFVEHAVSDEAIIDWRLYGVYSFFDQGPMPITCEVGDPLPVYFVRHIEGTLTDVPIEVIKRDFPIDENWSDMAARTQSGMVKVPSNFAIRIAWAHTAPPHPHPPFPP
jgi:hypothetical protein